jgi:hypothetical protein
MYFMVLCNGYIELTYSCSKPFGIDDHCLWDDYEGHHHYHLANWEMVSQKKEFGGLGIPSLAEMNMCLLASWIKRYHLDNDKLWKQIIDHKYRVNNPNLFYCLASVPSPF